MFSLIDNHRSFLRPSYTLTSALEAILDPLVTVIALYAITLLLGHVPGPKYVILGVLCFSLMFPGNAGFHERPRRVLRKLTTNWLLLVAILGSFGYASGYMAYFPRTVIWTWVLLMPVLLVAAHFAARQVLLHVLSEGHRQRSAVIATSFVTTPIWVAGLSVFLTIEILNVCRKQATCPPWAAWPIWPAL